MFSGTISSMMVFGSLFMMLIWILIIAGFFFFLNWMLRGHHGCCTDSFISILKERYARGEITKRQFDAMKKDLSKM